MPIPEQIVGRSSGAIKGDGGKLRWALLPHFLIEPFVRVLTHGAKKYAPNNWRGLPPTCLWEAAQRRLSDHTRALDLLFQSGYIDADGHMTEKGIQRTGTILDKNPDMHDMDEHEVCLRQCISAVDPESGLLHLDHAITGLILYREQLLRGSVSILPDAAKPQ